MLHGYIRGNFFSRYSYHLSIETNDHTLHGYIRGRFFFKVNLMAIAGCMAISEANFFFNVSKLSLQTNKGN